MQLLLAHQLGCSKLDLYLQFDRPLGEEELAPLRELLRRRGRREPLQHLLGTVAFLDREFLCDKRALIPRPETEELVSHMLEHPPALEPGNHVVDVGTGSGVIGLSLALAWKDQGLHFHLLDKDREALSLAKENAIHLEVPSENLIFRESDLLDVLTKPAKLVVANLPYIPAEEISSLQPEVQQDPALALDGGADGLELVWRLIEALEERLEPAGEVMLELGLGQASKVAGRLKTLDYEDVMIITDMSGIDRFVRARKMQS